MKISVIGLGKLGSPLAAVLASRGHTVVGTDLNETTVRAINDGRSPVEEPGMAECLAATDRRLSATMHIRQAVAQTEVTFILVPTPSGPDGRFVSTHVLSVAEEIGQVLAKSNQWHLIVLTSTVMPDCIEQELRPTLERYSGKTCGVDFGLCYNPKFVALGNVIDGLLNPDILLIGESDPKSGNLLQQLYETVCTNRPYVARMNFVNAELTKLAVNTYITTKISYANMLAEVCETLPGADVDIVTSALGQDTRIGPKFLKGALGYGGPCFPRDTIAFATLAQKNGVIPTLIEATNQINNRQVSRLTDLVHQARPNNAPVGILGLAYKPDTPVIDCSTGVQLAQRLLAAQIPVVVYDPLAMAAAQRVLGERVTYADNLASCAASAPVLVITTPDRAFSPLTRAMLNDDYGRPVVIDCWRILDRQALHTDIRYLTLGLGYSSSVLHG